MNEPGRVEARDRRLVAAKVSWPVDSICKLSREHSLQLTASTVCTKYSMALARARSLPATLDGPSDTCDRKRHVIFWAASVAHALAMAGLREGHQNDFTIS